MTKVTTKAAESSAIPSFQFFEGNLSISSSTPRITLRKGGLLVLSRAAVDLLGSEVKHVQLAYDPTTRIVGIRSCQEGTPGAYTLRSQKKTPSRLIGGKRFFSHHQLEITGAQTFAAEDFGNGIIGFRLPGTDPPEAEPKEARRSASRKKTA